MLHIPTTVNVISLVTLAMFTCAKLKISHVLLSIALLIE